MAGPFRLSSGLERDKFDNKTVTFEEHIKEEHNMWHYLCFIVLVKVKDSTEYTGPESYVAEMIKVRARGRTVESSPRCSPSPVGAARGSARVSSHPACASSRPAAPSPFEGREHRG